MCAQTKGITGTEILIPVPLIFLFPQPHAEEGTGAPLVLVHHHRIVVEDGIVHHEGGTGKIAG